MEAEGKPCQRNKDCGSNVCKMIYRNGEPIGRKCLNGTGDRYTKNCSFDRDCQSGICQPIQDGTGRIVAKRCVKAEKIDRDNPMDNILGKTSSYEKGGEYGIINDHALKIQFGSKGPISEAIAKIISIVFDLFSIIVYNFRRPSYDLHNQAILYSLFRTIAFSVFALFTGILHSMNMDGGIIGAFNRTAGTQDEENGETCKPSYRSIDMFYIRTLFTIIFPPLGVLMAKGFGGMTYILTSCLLTALFYFPGLIYSLSVVNSSKHAQLEAEQRNSGKKLNEYLKEKEQLKKTQAKNKTS